MSGGHVRRRVVLGVLLATLSGCGFNVRMPQGARQPGHPGHARAGHAVTAAPDRSRPLSESDLVALALASNPGLVALRAQRDSGPREALRWSEWLTAQHARTLVRRVQGLKRQQERVRSASTAATETLLQQRQNQRLGDATEADVARARRRLLDDAKRERDLTRRMEDAQTQLIALLGTDVDSARIVVEAPQLHAVDALDLQQLLQQATSTRLDLNVLRTLADGPAVADSLALPRLAIHRSPRAQWITRAQAQVEYDLRLQQLRSVVPALLADLAALQAQRQRLTTDLVGMRTESAAVALASQDTDADVGTHQAAHQVLLDQELALIALEAAQAQKEIALETWVGSAVWVSR